MEAVIYNKDGKETGKVALPEAVFGLPWNADLVHQVVNSIRQNEREPIAHTKDRSEVRGGGRKPWRQKGTGRARHGSKRSPIWVGGGVAHGPRNEEIFDKKINKKMRTKALFTALSQKARDGEIIFVDSLGMDTPKTKDASNLLEGLSKAGLDKINYKKGNRALLAVPERDLNAEKSFNNLGATFVDEVRNLNTLEVLNYKYLVMVDPDKSLAVLNDRAK